MGERKEEEDNGPTIACAFVYALPRILVNVVYALVCPRWYVWCVVRVAHKCNGDTMCVCIKHVGNVACVVRMSVCVWMYAYGCMVVWLGVCVCMGVWLCVCVCVCVCLMFFTCTQPTSS